LGGGLQIKVEGDEYKVGFWRRATRISEILEISNKNQLKEMGVKQF
jgi:hypothetical protein